jgi:uncharacterized membrane protein SpoIIM required for sporulation
LIQAVIRRRGSDSVAKKRTAAAPGLDGGYLGAVFCASFFLCGCFVGATAAGGLAPERLREYIAALDVPAGGGGLVGAAYFARLLSAVKYHAAAIFFGFSILGVACVPGLAAVRGFFLCFTVAAFARTYGAGGAALTAAMFAPNVVIAIPCFFILSAQSFTSSLALIKTASRKGGARGQPYGRRFFARCALCIPALAAASLADALLIPRVMAQLAGR